MKKLTQLLVVIFAAGILMAAFAGCTKAGRVRLNYLLITPEDGGTAYYEVNSVAGSYAAGVVEIPETYRKKPVKAVGVAGVGFTDAINFVAITLPESIEAIGNNAFKRCLALTIIMKGTVPATLGEDSFAAGLLYGGVKAIIVPDSALNTYKEADGWEDYASIIYSDANIVDNDYLVVDGVLISYFGKGDIVTVPQSATKVAGTAVKNNLVFKEVIVHKNVTEIDVTTFDFERISELRPLSKVFAKITVATDNTNYYSQGGVLYNGAKTEILVIPIVVSGEIVIPEGVTNLPAYGSTADVRTTFAYKNITSLSIPSTVKIISTGAFQGNTKLTSVTLAEGIEQILTGAFTECSRLPQITIPASVTVISEFAFNGCNKIRFTVKIAESEVPEGWEEGWNNGRLVTWA